MLRFSSLLSRLIKIYKASEKGLTPDIDLLWDVAADFLDYFEHQMIVEKAHFGKTPPKEISEREFELYGEYVLDRYGKRADELQRALESKNPEELLVAIDNAVNTFHHAESVLSHLNLREEDDSRSDYGPTLSSNYLTLLRLLKEQGKVLRPEVFKADFDEYRMLRKNTPEYERLDKEYQDIFGED